MVVKILLDNERILVMKKKIIVLLSLCFCVIVFLLFWKLKPEKIEKNKMIKENSKNIITTQYDQETDRYYIYDEKGEFITSVKDKEEIYWYEKHPEYKATPPGSLDLELEDDILK